MIELTVEQIEKAERLLRDIPDGAPRAMSRAINRATDAARTEAGRRAREGYHVKHGDVIKTIRVQKASATNLQALVISKGNLIPLSKFRITPKKPQPKRKAPITARVMRGAGGQIKGAFVARLKNGHVGVFNRAGKKRLPIVQRYGPSIPEMLNSPTVRTFVSYRAAEVMEQRLEHEIERLLGGQE